MRYVGLMFLGMVLWAGQASVAATTNEAIGDDQPAVAKDEKVPEVIPELCWARYAQPSSSV